MFRRANSQIHHTKDSQCTALSSILQLSSYIFTVVDFSSEQYSGSTGHRYSSYQQRNYSEVADEKTQTRNSLIRKCVL